MYYYLYNFILHTKIEFKMLKKVSSRDISDAPILHLYINSPLPQDADYILNFKENITYYFCPKNDSIFVETDDLSLLFSSFFNIPMSIFCLYKNFVLLHGNTLFYKNNLYCFCANKGIGKTTITALLSKNCNWFSDDCLGIGEYNNQIWGYNAVNTLKLCKNTCNHLLSQSIFNSYFDKLSQKAIIPASLFTAEAPCNKYPLKQIIFLSRNVGNSFELNPIKTRIQKAIYLIQSIVGTEYFDRLLIDIFKRTNLYEMILDKIDFYSLKIPDISNYTKENLTHLKNKIFITEESL